MKIGISVLRAFFFLFFFVSFVRSSDSFVTFISFRISWNETIFFSLSEATTVFQFFLLMYNLTFVTFDIKIINKFTMERKLVYQFFEPFSFFFFRFFCPILRYSFITFINFQLERNDIFLYQKQQVQFFLLMYNLTFVTLALFINIINKFTMK